MYCVEYFSLVIELYTLILALDSYYRILTNVVSTRFGKIHFKPGAKKCTLNLTCTAYCPSHLALYNALYARGYIKNLPIVIEQYTDSPSRHQSWRFSRQFSDYLRDKICTNYCCISSLIVFQRPYHTFTPVDNIREAPKTLL